MRAGGKWTPVLLSLLAAGLLIPAGFLLPRWGIEEWQIHRLGSDDRRVRRRAARALVKMQSARGASRLAAMIRGGPEGDRGWIIPLLFEMGPVGVEAVLRSSAVPEGPPVVQVFGAVLKLPRSQAAMAASCLTGLLGEKWPTADSHSEAELFRLQATLVLGMFSGERDDARLALVKLLHDPTIEVRRRAAWQLVPAGSMAVQQLLEALKDRSVRQAAAGALGQIGPDARAAIPALISLLGSAPPVEEEAAEALAQIDPEGGFVAAVVLSCQDGLGRQPAGGSGLLRSIAAYAGKREDVTRLFLRALAHEDPEVREDAARALRESKDRATVPALRKLLQDPEEKVRIQAAFALVIRQALPEGSGGIFIEAVRDGRYIDRDFAAARLSEAHADMDQAIPLLIELLGDFRARESALKALEGVAERLERFLPAFEAHLADLNLRADDPVFRLFRDLGPGASPLLPALRKALSRRGYGLRESLVDAIGALGPAAAPAINDLISCFTRGPGEGGGDEDLCDHVLQVLAAIGEPAVPSLLIALQDRDQDVRAASAKCLGKIPSGAERSIPALLTCLGDPSGDVRAASVKSLAALAKPIPSRAAEVGKAIEGLLRDRYRLARESAALATWSLTGKVQPALAISKELLGKEAPIRREGLDLLIALGPGAAPALSDLIPLLQGDEDAVRGGLGALAAIGPAARQAVPALEALRRSSDDPELEAAIDATLQAIRRP